MSKTGVPKHNFQRSVLERFLTDKQIDELEKDYCKARKNLRTSFEPTNADWRMFEKIEQTAEAMKHWNIGRETALKRLGQMAMIKNRQ